MCVVFVVELVITAQALGRRNKSLLLLDCRRVVRSDGMHPLLQSVCPTTERMIAPTKSIPTRQAVLPVICK